MNHRHLITALLALPLAACSTGNLQTPNLDDQFVRVSELMKSARCEINDAAKRKNARVLFNKVSMDFVLMAVETRGLTGTPELVLPLDGGKLTLAGSLGQTNVGKRVINYKFEHTVDNSLDCSSGVLEGGLGVKNWLASIDAVTTKTFVPGELSQKITFDIKRAKSAKPKFARDIGSGSRTISASLSNNRDLQHQVNLTIVPTLPGQKPSAPKIDTKRQEALEVFIDRFSDDDDN